MIRVCKLGQLLVPWVMVLLIRIPFSPSSTITMSLTSTITQSSAPIRNTLTFRISIWVVSVAVIGVIPTVFVTLEMNYLDLDLCYTESPFVIDRS